MGDLDKDLNAAFERMEMDMGQLSDRLRGLVNQKKKQDGPDSARDLETIANAVAQQEREFYALQHQLAEERNNGAVRVLIEVREKLLSLGLDPDLDKVIKNHLVTLGWQVS